MENNNKPVVHLISKPENMLKTIYTACRTCYSALGHGGAYGSSFYERGRYGCNVCSR